MAKIATKTIFVSPLNHEDLTRLGHEIALALNIKQCTMNDVVSTLLNYRRWVATTLKQGDGWVMYLKSRTTEDDDGDVQT